MGSGEPLTDSSDLEQRVRRSIEASIAVKQELLRSVETVSAMAKVSEILIAALQKGNKPLLFGNGGSAADAQHIAAEFVGRFAFEPARSSGAGVVGEHFRCYCDWQRLWIRSRVRAAD
jgi:hypothetical protein